MPAIKKYKYKLNNINSGRRKTPYLRLRFTGAGNGRRPPAWCLHIDRVPGSAPATDPAQWNVQEKASEEVAGESWPQGRLPLAWAFGRGSFLGSLPLRDFSGTTLPLLGNYLLHAVLTPRELG